MTRLPNTFLTSASLVLVTAALAACTTSPRVAPNQGLPTPPPVAAPSTIPPIQTGDVSTSDLPPIPGTTAVESNLPASGPGFVSPDAGGTTPAGGRNLSGPLSIDMLLGGWTANAGGVECRLNLTYTARGATGRYRASAPACAQQTLASVASWQLLGTQIQLYDASDALIGTLAQSGNRFIGTLSGGTSITVTG